MTEARKVKVTTPDQEEAVLNAPTPGDAAAEPPRIEFSVQELADKLSAREKECEELRDRMLRVSAEFENYKKRAARESEEFRRYANQSLLKEMLSAVDHIELAIQSAESAPETSASLIDGLRLTLKELLRVFDKFDVSAIEAVGKPFNPEFHEAIMREEGSALPENTICREMQKGYRIGGRLLRPSLVVVAAPTGPGALPEANTDA